LGGSAIAATLTALWKSQLMPPCGSRRFNRSPVENLWKTATS